MMVGKRVRRALATRSSVWGVCASLSLGACSVINQFDDVKPSAGGTAGASATGAGTSGATGTSATSTAAGTGSSGAAGTATAGASTGAGGSGTAASTGAGGSSTGTGPDAGSGTGGSTGGGSGTGGSAGTGGSSGGADGGTVDAPAEAAPPRILSCRFLIGSAMGGHRKLDEFINANGERTLADKFFMMPLGNGSSVRILTQLRGQQNTYLQYFASDSSSNQPAQPITSNGRLLDAKKTDPNTSAAMFVAMPPGGMTVAPQLMLHRFDDASSQSMPIINQVTASNALGGSGNVEAHFGAGGNGLAVAMSYTGPGDLPSAGFGVFSGAPITIVPLFSDMAEDNVRPTAVIRRGAAAVNYAFFGQPRQREYEISDAARSASETTNRIIPGPAFVLMAELNPMSKLNVVMADTGTVANPTLKLLIGQFDISQGLTFGAGSLVTAKSADSILQIPIGGLNGLNDDMLYMAGPTGPSRKELSLLFIDVLGRTRVEQKLKDTLGEVGNAAIVPRGSISVIGRYHIAWSETYSDMTGKYDVLYYDQLECL